MRQLRLEQLSIYYWLQDILPSFVTIKDEYPQTELVIPSVSIVSNSSMARPFELGADDRNTRFWRIHVFAKNSGQRDDYLDIIYSTLEDNICVYDYDQGFPSTSVDQIGMLVVKNRKFTNLRVYQDLVEKLYWWGVVDFATRFDPYYQIPAASASLTATAQTMAAAIDLAWEDDSSIEDLYSIEKSTDGSSFSELTTVAADVTSYSDTGLAQATLYYYRVRGKTGANYGSYSSTASDTTATVYVPTDLLASTASDTEIDLFWTDTNSGIASYEVYQSTDDSSYSLVDTTSAGATGYNVTGLTNNTLYYFKVKAVYGSLVSALTSAVSDTTKLELLFFDSFSVDEANPLTSPRSADIGTSLIVDTHNVLSISNDLLLSDPGGAANDPKIYTQDTYSPYAGLAGYIKLKTGSSMSGVWFHGGWGTNAGLKKANFEIYLNGAPRLWLNDGDQVLSGGPIPNYTADSIYSWFVIFGNGRNYLYMYDGSDYQLIWVDNFTPSYTTYTLAESDYTTTAHEHYIDTMAVDDFTSNYPSVSWTNAMDLCVSGTGAGTSSISTPANDDFSYTTNCKIDVTYDVVTTSGTGSFVYFWYQDSNNYSGFYQASSGRYGYRENNGSGNVDLALVTGVAADGDSIELVYDEGTVSFYLNGASTPIWTCIPSYASNGNGTGFVTKASGTMSNFTARTLDKLSGQCTDIIAGPLSNGDTFTHASNALLEVDYDVTATLNADKLLFRNSNWWFTLLNGSRIALYQNTGTKAYKITSGTLSLPLKARLSFVDNVYYLYNDNTLIGSYTDPNNYGVGETIGNVNIANGSESSDFIAYDSTPTGNIATALSDLESYT